MRVAATFVIALCMWAVSAAESAACSCAGGGTACAAVSRADAVFVGRVTDVSPGVQFDVERPVTGVEAGRITLQNGPGNCALAFTVGDRYVVYAHRDRAGVLFTNMCTRTRPLSDPRTHADIAYFDRLRQPDAIGGLLNGVIRDATSDLRPNAPAVRPLAEIQVSASFSDGEERTTTTQADGSYAFTGVPFGGVRISVRLPGQFEAPQPVSVTIAESRPCAEADMYARIDGRVRGQLLDEHGEAARGIALQLADPGAVRADTYPLRTLDAVTDEHGAFEFRYVGPGRYVLGVGLQSPMRPGKLHRRRFFDQTRDPVAAAIVQVGTAERRQLSPFRLAPLPADRTITVVVHAPDDEIARNVKLFLTGAMREPIEQTGLPLVLRLPFGAAYVLEATPPAGFKIVDRAIRIDRDDEDRVVEFRVER